MSGGVYDYAYLKVEDIANQIKIDIGCSKDLRQAFVEHLRLVARTLRAIEWNDSGDGASNEEELIRDCLNSSKIEIK